MDYIIVNPVGAKGNLPRFIAQKEGITEKEAYAKVNNFYTLEMYSEEIQVPIKFLKEHGLLSGNDNIKIPFYNEDKEEIAIKFVDKNSKYRWKAGSKVNLYGLWKIKEFEDDSYIFLGVGERMAHILWSNNIQAISIPPGKKFEKEYEILFERFEKIYVMNEGNLSSRNFIRELCKVFPYEKLYKIMVKDINGKNQDLVKLNRECNLNLDILINNSEKLEKEFYDNENKKICVQPNVEINESELPEEHVRIAEEVMKRLHIKYYRENFYVYEEGVYLKNLPLIEKTILSIKKNAKKNLRTEILEYIRISKNIAEMEINDQYINFKNGLYDLLNKKLIEHSPVRFTTAQINANYLEDEDIDINLFVEKFLDEVMCNNWKRKKALLQIIGYAMTFKTDLQKAFFFYGPTAKNGKSTTIDMINKLIGKDNICHLTVHQLGERFSSSDLIDKLLNTETEVSEKIINNIEVFKKVVTGDEFAVEQKYKNRIIIKPFAKFIWATNTLPRLENIDDEGFYRRINILPFEKSISNEERKKFDKEKIMNQKAIDYLANISLREYLKIMNKLELENDCESNSIVNKYRDSSDSVNLFFQDENTIKCIFGSDNKVLKTVMYSKYFNWCKENDFKIDNKKIFYNKLSKRPEYKIIVINGYDYIKNINLKLEDLNKKLEKF